MGNWDGGCHDEDVIRITTLKLLLLEILVKRKIGKEKMKKMTQLSKKVFFLFGRLEIFLLNVMETLFNNKQVFPCVIFWYKRMCAFG